MLLLAIIVIPVVYLSILNVVIPKGVVSFRVGWEDDSFQTEYSGPGWFDSNFTQGWSINWTDVNSGLNVEESVADVYATFNGYNPAHQSGISAVFIQKSINPINTSEYPYLVVRHRESSSDTSLTLSFALLDDNGRLHAGSYYHTSTSLVNLDANLGTVFNGIIKGILLLFMDGFDPNYAGGTQHAYFQTIGLYKTPPAWTLAYNNPINASISSENGVLMVYGEENLSAGTLVSAKRSTGLDFDFNQYRYLDVSIMTSGLDVATRIVIWTSKASYTVLLKTYDDRNWHTEIIDLTAWIGSGLSMVELGLNQIYPGSRSTVSYRQISFNSLEVP
jgi:hypothetical protein